MNFAEYVKSKRAEKNLSRSAMARQADFTPQYAMDIERGYAIPSEERISKLVEVLEMDERLAFRLADKIPAYVYEQAKEEYYNAGGRGSRV